jgi:hypothetical protein
MIYQILLIIYILFGSTDIDYIRLLFDTMIMLVIVYTYLNAQNFQIV